MSESIQTRTSELGIDGSVLRAQLVERQHRLREAMSGGEAVELKTLLAEVDAALERFDAGSYGVCEQCRDHIEVESLAVDPMTKVCLDCLSEEDQRALEYDLELAADIQQTMLPDRHLVTSGWEFHVYFQPAGPVSGDHFDLIRPRADRRQVFFILGDISGKGVSAAILGSHLQAIFRGLVTQGSTIDQIMERANRIFARATMANSYATMVFGKADSTGRIELANAGHPPPLLVRKDGVTPVEATGVPLGMFAHSRFDVCELRLEYEDRLFVYTDGLTEALNRVDEEFGYEAVSSGLAGGWGATAEANIEASLNALEKFTSGAPVVDDLTMLVVRRTDDARG